MPLSELRTGVEVEAGAAVSIYIVRPSEAALTLPAASVAFAERVCEPVDIEEVFMLQLPPMAVVLPRTVVPSVS